MIYTEREAIANAIIEKIKHGSPLSDFEKQYVTETLTDPLEEFCMREGTFRLIEILDVNPTEATDMEDEAAEIIRDSIDYSEQLYDDMDGELTTAIEKFKEDREA